MSDLYPQGIRREDVTCEAKHQPEPREFVRVCLTVNYGYRKAGEELEVKKWLAKSLVRGGLAKILEGK